MAHAQHFLGSNAWVPTVRESIHKTNPQRASGLPRIAATMGLEGHMDSSANLQSSSATVTVNVAVRKSKSEEADCNSSNERLPDSATYQMSKAGQGDGGWQRLCPNSLVVPSVALTNGEAVRSVQPQRKETEPVDSVNFDSRSYKMVTHHDRNIFRLAPVEDQGVSELSIGAAQPGAHQVATPKSFTITTTGSSMVSWQAPSRIDSAPGLASPPWFDPAGAARAGFKGRITFHIGSPHSDMHESPSAASIEGKSRDTGRLFDTTSQASSHHLEGAGDTSSLESPRLPLYPSS
jgi:hypothetical protein